MPIFNERNFEVLAQVDFLEHIRTGLKRQERGRPAFTLLIGAGFSTPLIPTTREMVERDVAWWLFRRERHECSPFAYCTSVSAEFHKFQADLWREISKSCDQKFILEGDYPALTNAENIGRAYQAIMNAKSINGLSNSHLRRQYMRDVGRRAENKINSAHLYLASILQAQDDWSIGSPFCRTIFTTNFDTLLQRSLQLVSKLYYMTDSPDLLESPEDDGEAIHLIYCHGSMHRQIILNTDYEIQKARETKSPYFTPYFEKHGVIIVGHSGWRDVIIESLLQSKTFAGNLYWCDIHSASDARARLNEGVVSLLSEHRGKAFYVPIASADSLMVAMHSSMELSYAPQFIINPMKQMFHSLESVDLSQTKVRLEVDSKAVESLSKVIERTLQRLRAAKQAFDEPESLRGQAAAQVAEMALTAKRLNDALMAATPDEIGEAISAWTDVIEDPDAIIKERLEALINRGCARLSQKRPALAIEDFTAVLRMPEVSAEQRAMILVNRAKAYMDQDWCEDAVKDFTAVLELSDSPIAQQVEALLGRAEIYWMRRKRGKREETDFLAKAIADYAAIIGMVDVSQDHLELALCRRGMCHEFKKDLRAAFADFTKVIEMPGVSLRRKAFALASRAEVRYQVDREDVEKFVADSAAALHLAPTMNSARLNLVLGLLLRGDSRLALVEFGKASRAPVIIYAETLSRIKRGRREGRINDSAEVESIENSLKQSIGVPA